MNVITDQELMKEFLERARPFMDLKAKIALTCPVDFIMADEVLSPMPRPSDQAKALLASIDEFLDLLARDVAKRRGHGGPILGPTAMYIRSPDVE